MAIDANDNAPQSPIGPQPTESQATPASAPQAAATPFAVKGLRLWPALAILAVQWLIVFVVGLLAPLSFFQFMTMAFAPLVGALALVIWWVGFSRLRWMDSLLCLVVFAATTGIAVALFDPSFGGFGIMMYVVPTVTLVWIGWLLITPFLPWSVRRAGMLVAFTLAVGYFALLRFDGATGSLKGEISYRWTPTPEDIFKAEKAAGKLGVARGVDASKAKPLALQTGDWPGFRGADRDGHLTGVQIATDWSKNPPKEIWRHRVGPGWGSFTVIGNHLFTQEQWGEEEAVVCYDASTGEIIWDHKDKARFTEAVAGPGPRATPTFHEGNLYVLGAAGKLNCLDAASGRLIWSRDIKADSKGEVPVWGFASSPFVAQGVVTVFAGGPEGKSVMGYKIADGELAWSAGEGQLSYCSLQPTRIGGVDQLVIATEKGLTAFGPASGQVLWLHKWELDGMARVVQPTVVGEGDVLLGTGFGFGTKRVHVDKTGDNWATNEIWTTRAIKPYYNDLVVHKGHAYGFDNDFFTCINLADGKSKWRERGYGNGQVLLLADQDLLLVVAETGEVALVEANPAGHKELGQFKALEGKTWNHPVIAHGKLFVRNGVEAASYQLTEISGK
jgi:outer membrane protein assembly factor BamB